MQHTTAGQFAQVAGIARIVLRLFIANGRVGQLGSVAAGHDGQSSFIVLTGNLGVLVQLQVAHTRNHRAQAGEAAALAWPFRAEQMNDVGCWHALALRLLAAQAGVVTWMLRPQPVRNGGAQGIVFDTVDHVVTTNDAGARTIEPIDFQQLELQRYRQVVRRAARTQPDQHFAVRLHSLIRGCLQAVVIVTAVSVAHLHPALEQRVDGLGLGAGGARHDTGADGGRYQALEAGGDIGHVLYQRTRLGAQRRSIGHMVGVGAGAGTARAPGIARAGGLVGAFQLPAGNVAGHTGGGIDPADHAVDDVFHQSPREVVKRKRNTLRCWCGAAARTTAATWLRAASRSLVDLYLTRRPLYSTSSSLEAIARSRASRSVCVRAIASAWRINRLISKKTETIFYPAVLIKRYTVERLMLRRRAISVALRPLNRRSTSLTSFCRSMAERRAM